MGDAIEYKGLTQEKYSLAGHPDTLLESLKTMLKQYLNPKQIQIIKFK
jgi:hypothetical protein